MNFGARVRYVVGDRDPDLVRLDRAAEQARGRPCCTDGA
jgi:hypothetical protein